MVSSAQLFVEKLDQNAPSHVAKSTILGVVNKTNTTFVVYSDKGSAGFIHYDTWLA